MTRWFLDNTVLKIISLVLAIFTWFFVKNMTSERRLVEDVLFDFKTKPTLTVARSAPTTVNVVVRGTHADIWQLSRTELTAVVDLRREEQAGSVRVSLLPHAIRHPPRVQIVQVTPAAVTVRLVPAEAVDSPPAPGVKHSP